MFSVPEKWCELSRHMTEVLQEIGVTEEMVQRRRKTKLTEEAIETVSDRLRGVNISHYRFGSRSEGTLTMGLESDADSVGVLKDWLVINDLKNWKPGVHNFLMIEDENTAPGYCLLQILRHDTPLPVQEVTSKDHVRYKNGTVILKNTERTDLILRLGMYRSGPAAVIEQEGYSSRDAVLAYPCNFLPQTVLSWLDRQHRQGRITLEMIENIESKGIFVVSAPSKLNDLVDCEWRISTSHVERRLMFDLNITQIHCYILMKMILKTFMHSENDKALTSFMCKNTLLTILQHVPKEKWNEDNLLTCLVLCLNKVRQGVVKEKCPHFIIPDNNLMAERFSGQQRMSLLETLQFLVQNIYELIFNIEIDGLGTRLLTKHYPNHPLRRNPKSIYSSEQLFWMASASILRNLASLVSGSARLVIEARTEIDFLRSTLLFMTQSEENGDEVEKAVALLLKPLVSSSLGSMMASRDIQAHRSVSADALSFLACGMDSDVASGKLKLACVLFCAGDWQGALIQLEDIARHYDTQQVEPMCKCYRWSKKGLSIEFAKYANTHEIDGDAIRHTMAYCVMFFPPEIHCAPPELQYEMFRSTPDDIQYRSIVDWWMDYAVVDSLPFLHFLLYKTYSLLDRTADKKIALENLSQVIHTYQPGLLGHRETGMNLLGQCLEQEHRYEDALRCYAESLRIRPRNNAAKWHICKLLCSLLS